MRMRKKRTVSVMLTLALTAGCFAGTGITARAGTFEVGVSSDKLDSGGGEITVTAAREELKDEVWWTLEKQIPAAEGEEIYETVGEKRNVADVDGTHTKTEFTVDIPENTEAEDAAYRIRIAETDPYNPETDEYAWEEESEKIVVAARADEGSEDMTSAGEEGLPENAVSSDSETEAEDGQVQEKDGQAPAEETLEAMAAGEPEAMAAEVQPQDTEVPVYHNIPPYQRKDLDSAPSVKVSGIRIEEIVGGRANGEKRPYTAPITFKIVDTTRQEIETIVEAKDGVLPDLNLTENHTYTIYSQDESYKVVREDGNTEFKLSINAYIWVNNGKIRNIKQGADTYDYPEFTTIQVAERAKDELKEDDRHPIHMKVLYKNTGVALGGIKLKFVSDREIIETTTTTGENNTPVGRINNVNLLEDVNYIIVVESDKYDIEAFPLTVKDKSEYRTNKGRPGIRYFYDHSDCHQVEEIRLVDKADAHKNDKTVTSLSGNTTVSGFNFKDIFIMDRKLDTVAVNGLDDKDYDVVEIRSVNPHRWEIAKLAAGNFRITEKIDNGKTVQKVYYVDQENNPHPLAFETEGNTVSFTMNSLSLYPVVFEYGDGDIDKVKEELGKAIEEREKYTQADYTSKSWKAYSAKVDEADVLLKAGASTYRQLSCALKSVEGTRNGLVRRVNVVKPETLTALEKAIKKAEALRQTDYTAGSWTKFSNALKTAQGLLKDEDATETDCQNALKELERTQTELVSKNLPATAKVIKVANVAISGSSYKIAAGRKLQLNAEVTPANASNKAVEWRTSNVKYAAVDSKGKVTTKKAGAGKTVKITAIAKDGSGKKGECQIKIMKHAVKKISLKAKKTVKAGKKLTVKATVKTTGKSANKKLEWTSSNTKYATVNSKGRVSAKKAGKGQKVKITAKATDGSGKKKTVTIKIK